VTWREKSYKSVRETLQALPSDATEKEARRALRAAYPFGERSRYPYKAWCSVCRWALAARFPKGKASYQIFNAKERKRGVAPLPASVIKNLFSEAGL
jgi:hypothetical protein